MKPVPALALVAISSALLSAGCLGGAYTLANVNDSGSTELITREIPWDGSAKASLGLPAVFLFGGAKRTDQAKRYPLQHGDVAVWGGPSRLFFHGVAPVKDGDHTRLGRCRINLTFRQAR